MTVKPISTQDQHEAGDESRDDDVARQPAGERDAGAEDQTMNRIQVGTSDRARSCPRTARKAMRPAPVAPMNTNDRRANVAARRGSTMATAIERELRQQPDRDQHAYEAVPQPQAAGTRARKTTRLAASAGFGRRSDRRRWPPASSGTACGRSRSRRRDRPARTTRRGLRPGTPACGWRRRWPSGRWPCRPVRPSMTPLKSWRSRDLELVVERLPQIQAREALRRKLGDVT